MQFLQPTFDAVVTRHSLPPGCATPPSRYNPHAALFAYDHADWYVQEVLVQAAYTRISLPSTMIECS